MKKIIVFTTILLIIVNALAGVMISAYPYFNAIATSVTLLLTGGLIYAVAYYPIKDSFRASFTFLFFFIGIILYLLMMFSKSQLQDNWCVTICVVLTAIECILLFTAIQISKKNNQ